MSSVRSRSGGIITASVLTRPERLRSLALAPIAPSGALLLRLSPALLAALVPRTYLDPNRHAGDIDLELMEGGHWPHAHVPSGSQAVHADRTLRLYVLAGVTTARGMLGAPMHLALRDSIAAGQRIGPRLLTSGPSFNGNSVTSAAVAAHDVLVGLVPSREAAYDAALANSLAAVPDGVVLEDEQRLEERRVAREAADAASGGMVMLPEPSCAVPSTDAVARTGPVQLIAWVISSISSGRTPSAGR